MAALPTHPSHTIPAADPAIPKQPTCPRRDRHWSSVHLRFYPTGEPKLPSTLFPPHEDVRPFSAGDARTARKPSQNGLLFPPCKLLPLLEQSLNGSSGNSEYKKLRLEFPPLCSCTEGSAQKSSKPGRGTTSWLESGEASHCYRAGCSQLSARIKCWAATWKLAMLMSWIYYSRKSFRKQLGFHFDSRRRLFL